MVVRMVLRLALVLLLREWARRWEGRQDLVQAGKLARTSWCVLRIVSEKALEYMVESSNLKEGNMSSS